MLYCPSSGETRGREGKGPKNGRARRRPGVPRPSPSAQQKGVPFRVTLAAGVARPRSPRRFQGTCRPDEHIALLLAKGMTISKSRARGGRSRGSHRRHRIRVPGDVELEDITRIASERNRGSSGHRLATCAARFFKTRGMGELRKDTAVPVASRRARHELLSPSKQTVVWRELRTRAGTRDTSKGGRARATRIYPVVLPRASEGPHRRDPLHACLRTFLF